MQLALFVNCYARCDSCGHDVQHLNRVRRFRVCDACLHAYSPTFDGYAENAEQRAEVSRYWGWYSAMERRLPSRLPIYRPRVSHLRRSLSEFIPECPVCGRVRSESAIVITSEMSIFGRPRQCDYCWQRGLITSAHRLMSLSHPDWDDEDALDWLYQHYPQAFTMGILPSYWYELARQH
jgi:hypothetical protein